MPTTRTPAEKTTKKTRPVRQARPTQRLLTVAQVTELYGFPPRTTHDLITNGKLAAVQFVADGRVWIERADVDRLIEQSRRTHAASVE